MTAHTHHGRAVLLEIENVPSFSVQLDQRLKLPAFGEILADISFGGQFNVQARAEDFGLKLDRAQGPKLIRPANVLLAAVREQCAVVHPTRPHLNTIHLPILYGESKDPRVNGVGAVVMPTEQPQLSSAESWDAGTLDRSPGGTGTCARMAVEQAKGNLELGEEFVQQSLLGTTFTGKLQQEVVVAGHPMLQPPLRGCGWIVGHHQLVIEPDDPFPVGLAF